MIAFRTSVFSFHENVFKIVSFLYSYSVVKLVNSSVLILLTSQSQHAIVSPTTLLWQLLHLDMSSTSERKEEVANAVASLKTLDLTSDAPEEKERLLEVLTTIRKFVTSPEDRRTAEVLAEEPLPIFIQILKDATNSEAVLLETMWIIGNLAAGSSSDTEQVANSGTLEIAVGYLDHPNAEVAEQVVRLFGNVSGESEEYRDMLLNVDTAKHLFATYIQVMKAESCEAQESLLECIFWLCHNLLRGENFPKLSLVAPLADLIDDAMIHAPSTTDITDLLWAACFLTESPFYSAKMARSNTFLHAIRERGINSGVLTLVVPIVRTIGSLVSNDAKTTQSVIDAGFLPTLVQVYRDNVHIPTHRDVLWTLSNITAGTREQVCACFACDGVIDVLLDGLSSSDVDVATNAAFAVSNPLAKGASYPGLYDITLLTAIVSFLAHRKTPKKFLSLISPALKSYLRSLIDGEGDEGDVTAALAADWSPLLKSPAIRKSRACRDMIAVIHELMGATPDRLADLDYDDGDDYEGDEDEEDNDYSNAENPDDHDGSSEVDPSWVPKPTCSGSSLAPKKDDDDTDG